MPQPQPRPRDPDPQPRRERSGSASAWRAEAADSATPECRDMPISARNDRIREEYRGHMMILAAHGRRRARSSLAGDIHRRLAAHWGLTRAMIWIIVNEAPEAIERRKVREARRTLARTLLANGGGSLTQVARLVGLTRNRVVEIKAEIRKERDRRGPDDDDEDED